MSVAFPNPASKMLPNRVWVLLLRYFEVRHTFRSCSWPDSGFRHVKHISRRGNVMLTTEGPYMCLERSTSPACEFGDLECDEVGGCYMALSPTERLAIEAVVAGVVCGYPVMCMREFAKRSGISQRKAYMTRRVALLKLAKACREKGIE